MTDSQRHILQLTLEVDDICRRHGIEYYLDGGSVLGAVRHGGFIPWDDDIDLVMTRPNWEKFLAVIDSELRPDRAFCTPERNPGYPTTSMRYVDTGSTAIFRSLMMDVAALGYCVDIFVLEAYPREKERQEKYKRDLSAYIEYLQRYYVVREDSNAGDYIENVRLARTMGREKLLKTLFSRIDTIAEWDECEQYIIRWGGFGFQIYDRELFGKPKYVPFEDAWLPVPEHERAYLRSHFGEDWYMMPAAAPKPHDVVETLDAGYKEYVRDYMQFISKRGAIRHYDRAKLQRMKAKRSKLAVTVYEQEESAIGCALETEARISGENLEGLLRAGELERLEELFAPYLHKQPHYFFIYYNTLVPLPDSVIYYPLYCLMARGNIKAVNRILAVREKRGGALSERLMELKNAVKLHYDSLWAEEKGDVAEAVRLSDEALALHPRCPQLLKRRLALKIAAADGREELCELLGEAEGLEEQFPNDLDFRKYIADMLAALGESAAARALYTEFCAESANGMLIRDAERALEALPPLPADTESEYA